MPSLYNAIGTNYVATRRPDPEIVAQLATLLALESGRQYLDVGCGTCNYTSAMAAQGGSWFGVDASEVMLQTARRKYPMLSLTLGDAHALPFKTGTFDGAICTLAIHHFSDLAAAFSEVRRVIRSGRFVIFTGVAEQMQNYWLWHYFPQMMQRSTSSMPRSDLIRKALLSAGFNQVNALPYSVGEELQDLFLYSGKYRPELYFNQTVRSNISSFARLCSEDELRSGLERLRSDVASGAFKNVAASFSSSEGDYAYVTARTDA